MKLLLDTRAYVWHALNDPRLPGAVRTEIDDPANDVAASIASFWEIGIKTSIGKWPMPINVRGLQKLAEEQSIDIVPISMEAIHYMASMDWFNKDPFDRLIAATASIRGDILVTIEESFGEWGIKRLW